MRTPYLQVLCVMGERGWTSSAQLADVMQVAVQTARNRLRGLEKQGFLDRRDRLVPHGSMFEYHISGQGRAYIQKPWPLPMYVNGVRIWQPNEVAELEGSDVR